MNGCMSCTGRSRRRCSWNERTTRSATTSQSLSSLSTCNSCRTSTKLGLPGEALGDNPAYLRYQSWRLAVAGKSLPWGGLWITETNPPRLPTPPGIFWGIFPAELLGGKLLLQNGSAGASPSRGAGNQNFSQLRGSREELDGSSFPQEARAGAPAPPTFAAVGSEL